MLHFNHLENQHIVQLVSCLSRQDSDYMLYYHPFDFSCEAIYNLLSSAIDDLYIAIFYNVEVSQNLVGLLTLRGLDEGYESPMLGIFIAQEVSGQGFARQSLLYAESLCVEKGWDRLMLKVDIENTRAIKAYQAAGFSLLAKADSRTMVMIKEIRIR